MLARRGGACARGGQAIRAAADHRRGIHLCGRPQIGGAGDGPGRLRRAFPADQPVPPRGGEGRLCVRARRSRGFARRLPAHLAAADRPRDVAAARGRALAARALRRAPVDRGGTAGRLRCAPFATPGGAGPGSRRAASGCGRRAHASAQPPGIAGRADRDPPEHAPERSRVRLVSQRRTLLAARTAPPGALSGAFAGRNARDCRALHVHARRAAL